MPSVLTLNPGVFTPVELGLEKPPYILNAPEDTYRLDQVLEAPSAFSVKELHTITPIFSMRQHFAYLLSSSDNQSGMEDNDHLREQLPDRVVRSVRTLDPNSSGSVRWKDMVDLFNGIPDNNNYTEDLEDRHGHVYNFNEFRKYTILPVLQVKIRSNQTPVNALADSGASASIACYKTLSKQFSKNELSELIVEDPSAPSFRTANSEISRPLGSITLEFYINDVQFTWKFWVIPECAYPFIFGNDFLSVCDTSILYNDGLIEFTSQEGIRTSVVFETGRKPSQLRQSCPLYASHSVTIPPSSALAVKVHTHHSDILRKKSDVFGIIAAHWKHPDLLVGGGVCHLDRGTLTVLVTNPSPSEPLNIRNLQPLGSFRELDRKRFEEDYDEYAVDLTKLGEDGFFVDLNSIYPDADFGSDEPEPQPSRPPDITQAERPPPERCKPPENHVNSLAATESLPDKFLPFDDSDVAPVHMPRLSKAEILKLSDSEILSHFETGPLSHLTLGANLTKDQDRKSVV